jgi:hypothetical protein
VNPHPKEEDEAMDVNVNGQLTASTHLHDAEEQVQPGSLEVMSRQASAKPGVSNSQGRTHSCG